MNITELQIPSTLDGSLQPSLFHHPGEGGTVPLVVGLHTWSYDRFNQVEHYLPLCRRYGWALLLPEFRGPNLSSNPNCHDACGSRTARQDVLDAVEYVCGNSSIDRDNVFLLGCSGGGQAALLTAGDTPELFRAVDAWCPVSDLTAWHRYLVETGQHYFADMESCLGGSPDELPAEYAARSPVSFIESLKRLPVSIHHGRHDTVVPWRHSQSLVTRLEDAGAEELYFDVFDGEHEQFPSHSFEWFARLAHHDDAAVAITG